ncbi:MerR family transcriptional regulator [Cryptosporangium minutisporangium]|uniref:MerR family transcriptional regulator n=1 Tax=Cryptosporangium minutisporangium TaxID=113569 RepID=A0ABP6T4G2_9ACTN
MQIGELSRRTGVSVRSLRYYEEEGLLYSTRCANGYRRYDDEAVERVEQIRGMIESGLPTRIIRDILPFVEAPTALMPRVPCDRMLTQVAEQREHLHRRIEILRRNRDALDAYLGAARTAAEGPQKA